MKVIEKGRPQKGWAVESKCTGGGNGGGGCGAKLLVEKGDVYQTQSSAMGETDYYYTFTCPECHVETDLKDIPNTDGVFMKAEWITRKEALKPFIEKPINDKAIAKAAEKLLKVYQQSGMRSDDDILTNITCELMELLKDGS